MNTSNTVGTVNSTKILRYPGRRRTMIIGCIDGPQVIALVDKFRDTHHLVSFLTRPGGLKSLTYKGNNPIDILKKDSLIEEIRFSAKNHNVESIILTGHENCLAWNMPFADLEEERDHHQNVIQTAETCCEELWRELRHLEFMRYFVTRERGSMELASTKIQANMLVIK